MTRERDLSFESLAEATGATVASERGALNAALKMIREEEPDLADEDLALLIRLRADDYRKVYPEMACTPTALAKHWNRIFQAVEERSQTKRAAAKEEPIYVCRTCGGDRIVTVSYRQSSNPLSPYEEVAPCPDCGTGKVSWWRYDGTHRQTPDPEEVRRLLSE